MGELNNVSAAANYKPRGYKPAEYTISVCYFVAQQPIYIFEISKNPITIFS